MPSSGPQDALLFLLTLSDDCSKAIWQFCSASTSAQGCGWLWSHFRTFMIILRLSETFLDHPRAPIVDCSEAIWQRCWASASDAKLRVGAVWGAAQVSLLVFVFGFAGFLAVWGGLWVPSGPDDPGNTILFSLLNSQGQQVRSRFSESRLGCIMNRCELSWYLPGYRQHWPRSFKACNYLLLAE